MAFVMPGLQKVTGEIGSWFGQKKKQPVIQEGDISGPTVGGGPTGIALPSGKNIFGSTPLIAEDFLKPVQVQNPYEEQLKAALGQSMAPDFTQAQQTAGGQASFAEALRGLYGTGAGGLSGLIGTLQRQQAGDFGPGGSLAQKILEQGLGQNIAGVRSQLASQRGLSPALAARYAAQQTAQLGGQTAQQAGILGLQQQLAAQQLLGQLSGQAATLGSKGADVLGQMRGQDIAQATATSDAALKRLGILASSDTGIRQLQAQTGMSENEIRMKIKAANQAAAAGDRQMAASILGGVLGGASQGAAAVATKGLMAYDGGRIKGEAPVSGDHPQNDIVPANLSPGEIVIPRSAAGSKKAAKSFIDSLDDWDEEPSYSKVLKARNQKKNYADGGVVEPDMDQEILDMSRRKYLEKGFDAPIPGVAPMKQSLDEMLTSRVVEPMARAGYPTLGAAMATVPSTLAEALIPSTAADLAGTLIPFPKGKLGKAKEVLKEEGSALLEKMGKKIKEAPEAEVLKSSLEKGGWYDQIGGQQGLISKLDDLAKANPDDPRIERFVKNYKDNIAASEKIKGDTATEYDSKINQQNMAQRQLENLTDYIDSNLNKINMPSLEKKKALAFEIPNDDFVELFHGSKTGLDEIKDNYNPYGVDFGGVFASPRKVAAESHGDKIYSTKIKKADILDQNTINDLMDEEKINQFFVKNTKLDPKNQEYTNDLELLKKTVLQNESVFNLDEQDINKIKQLVKTNDIGELDWELQTLRGKIGKSLGYKAVEMPDEHGVSYLIFPGNKITKIK